MVTADSQRFSYIMSRLPKPLVVAITAFSDYFAQGSNYAGKVHEVRDNYGCNFRSPFPAFRRAHEKSEIQHTHHKVSPFLFVASFSAFISSFDFFFFRNFLLDSVMLTLRLTPLTLRHCVAPFSAKSTFRIKHWKSTSISSSFAVWLFSLSSALSLFCQLSIVSLQLVFLDRKLSFDFGDEIFEINMIIFFDTPVIEHNVKRIFIFVGDQDVSKV